MELPDTFFTPIEFCNPNKKLECRTPNALGYLEFGFMSTTSERSVAIQYSGVQEGKLKASIMEIHPNSVDRGADLSDFSQYSLEKEYLFVPYSFVQGEGRQRTELTVEGGVLTVIPVRVNMNLKTERLEDREGKKKKMHVTAFESIIDETLHWLRVSSETESFYKSAALVELLEYDFPEQDEHAKSIFAKFKNSTPLSAYEEKVLSDFGCKYREELDIRSKGLIASSKECLDEILQVHRDLVVQEFVDDLRYSRIVSEMLNAAAFAKHRFLLWTQDGERFEEVNTLKLLQAHRRRLANLKAKFLSSEIGTGHRKRVAAEILRCKGLMSSDDPNDTINGEPLMFIACSNGWAFSDVQVGFLCPAMSAFASHCI